MLNDDEDDTIAWDDDDLESDEATESALLSDTSTASDSEATPDRAELEQKLRSAEGRYQKSEEKLREFESSIADMREQLASLNPVAGPDDDQDTGEPEEVVPEGWSKEEWEDYKDDQPVTAELQEQQIRQVQKIREDLDTQRQQQEAKVFHEQFRSTVIAAHPDFDDLLNTQRTEIESFITSQTNPLVRDAYQRAYDQGTADEVVQLLGDYKQTRSPNGRRLSSKAEEALAVTGRGSQPNVGYSGQSDPDDFDAAWEDFPDDMDD